MDFQAFFRKISPERLFFGCSLSIEKKRASREANQSIAVFHKLYASVLIVSVLTEFHSNVKALWSYQNQSPQGSPIG